MPSFFHLMTGTPRSASAEQFRRTLPPREPTASEGSDRKRRHVKDLGWKAGRESAEKYVHFRRGPRGEPCLAFTKLFSHSRSLENVSEHVKLKTKGDFILDPVTKPSLSNAGGTGSLSAQATKIPHALGPKKQNMKQKQYCDKFNKDLKSK